MHLLIVHVYDDAAMVAERRRRRQEEMEKLWFCIFILLWIVVFPVEICLPNAAAGCFIALSYQNRMLVLTSHPYPALECSRNFQKPEQEAIINNQ